MADETPPPPAAPGPPERRRPAPTIDLEATEIASGIASGIASDPAAAAAAGPEQTSPHGQPPDQDTAPNMPPKSAAHRSLSGLAAAVSWPLVGAGLGGALVTLGVVWVVTLGADRGGDSRAAEARIAQLERQVADLAGRAPADASGSDLANRLQKLEAQAVKVAAPSPAADPAQANRIAALEAQLKSLGETVGALGLRSESTAAANAAALSELTQKLARSDPLGAQSNAASNAASSAASSANAALIAALADRIDALEGSAKTTETMLTAELAKRAAESSDDRAVRTALVAAALAAVVERGRPFAAELKAAQSQAADASALAPLEGFAATGVPNAGVLLRELSSLEPALLRAAGAGPSEGGFLEKLQANAERLVRIRPIEEIPGDDPAAVIARIEVKVVHADLPGALMELGNLPATVRAPALAWIAKAQARADALAASRTFAADALAALAKPPR
jgi:hypothetical protein